MKNLSIEKANRLRAGQMLHWVEAYVEQTEDSLTFTVKHEHRLLVGKKSIKPAPGWWRYTPPLACFTAANGEEFTLPWRPQAQVGQIWFFANRRSAVQAAEELLAGKQPELVLSMLNEARENARHAALTAERAKEWRAKAPKDAQGRPLAIRAYGESEIWPTHVPAVPVSAEILERNTDPGEHQRMVQDILAARPPQKLPLGASKPLQLGEHIAETPPRRVVKEEVAKAGGWGFKLAPLVNPEKPDEQ